MKFKKSKKVYKNKILIIKETFLKNLVISLQNTYFEHKYDLKKNIFYIKAKIYKIL